MLERAGDHEHEAGLVHLLNLVWTILVQLLAYWKRDKLAAAVIAAVRQSAAGELNQAQQAPAAG